MTIPTIESRSSWVVAGVSVALLATSFGALWITAVGLKAIDHIVANVEEGVPSLA